METLVHADIFFFISSIGFVVFILLALVITYWVVRILREVQSVLVRIHEEIDAVSDELHELKSHVSERVVALTQFLGAITSAQFFKHTFGGSAHNCTIL